MPFTVKEARTPEELEGARAVFHAYREWLESDLKFTLDPVAYDAEMASLPGRYAAPQGEILVARRAGSIVGAIAFYRFGSDIAELKRFYVMPGMGGHGIGRALFDAALKVAKARHYRRIRLDTIARMMHARRIYTHYKFETIAPYNDQYVNTPDILYLELDLQTL